MRDGQSEAGSEQPISALGESALTFSANQRGVKNKEQLLSLLLLLGGV